MQIIYDRDDDCCYLMWLSANWKRRQGGRRHSGSSSTLRNGHSPEQGRHPAAASGGGGGGGAAAADLLFSSINTLSLLLAMSNRTSESEKRGYTESFDVVRWCNHEGCNQEGEGLHVALQDRPRTPPSTYTAAAQQRHSNSRTGY